MPMGLRLRLHRYFLDRETIRAQRQIVKNGGRPADVWEDGTTEFEYKLLEEDEVRFHSEQLLKRARELRIPTPPVYDGTNLTTDYQRSGLNGHSYYLSLIGEQKVRAAIREEEKYRSERWTRRIPYLTALSGLIGTITGLVALLAKWRS
jgi:hypothetical protein